MEPAMAHKRRKMPSVCTKRGPAGTVVVPAVIWNGAPSSCFGLATRFGCANPEAVHPDPI